MNLYYAVSLSRIKNWYLPMIKDILNDLDDKERRLLMYAFENDLAQYIDLGDGKYVGVNTSQIKHLEPIEVAGLWAYGNDRSSNG